MTAATPKVAVSWSSVTENVDPRSCADGGFSFCARGWRARQWLAARL